MSNRVDSVDQDIRIPPSLVGVCRSGQRERLAYVRADEFL
jgi:hypothetical protein